jgi:chromosome segregation ATPase
VAGFLDKLLSGNYPKLEALWVEQFGKLVDDVFAKIDLEESDVEGLDAEFDASAVEADLNTEIEALRADLQRLEDVLAKERSAHAATMRDLAAIRAELKTEQYRLTKVRSALLSGLHEEPFG